MMITRDRREFHLLQPQSTVVSIKTRNEKCGKGAGNWKAKGFRVSTGICDDDSKNFATNLWERETKVEWKRLKEISLVGFHHSFAKSRARGLRMSLAQHHSRLCDCRDREHSGEIKIQPYRNDSISREKRNESFADGKLFHFPPSRFSRIISVSKKLLFVSVAIFTSLRNEEKQRKLESWISCTEVKEREKNKVMN